MEKYFKALLLLLLASCSHALSSCQEGGDAGDLFGQWRLADSNSLYISFSGSVAWLKEPSASPLGVYGNFQHKGDSLFVQCYSAEALASDTTLVETSFGFRPFGNLRMKVETLSADRLVLSQGSRQWTFYKY